MTYKNPTPTELAGAKIAAAPSATELQAREMLALYRSTTEWSSARQVVINVFWSQWSSALCAEDVAKIGDALYGGVSTTEVADALTTMVRGGVLRARVVRFQRLYELNF